MKVLYNNNEWGPETHIFTAPKTAFYEISFSSNGGTVKYRTVGHLSYNWDIKGKLKDYEVRFDENIEHKSSGLLNMIENFKKEQEIKCREFEDIVRTDGTFSYSENIEED